MRKDLSRMTTAELLQELDRTLLKARNGVRDTGRAVESMETILRRAREVDYIMGIEPYIEPLQ